MKTIEFSIGDKVVYPSHGVGEITEVKIQTISGFDLEVYVIFFAQDKMTLRIPVRKASSSGLRPLVELKDIEKIYDTLKGKAKQGNRMWSRRAQEYETKINSGNIVSMAEVVRDLYKNTDADRSYSERTIYESALNRLASEIAILEKINKEEAALRLIEVLREKVAA